MQNNIPPPILICGAARSGTSLVAGIIEKCGAFGGVMYGPNKNNLKGMYENRTIRSEIVKPYLKTIGADQKCQYPFPDISKLMIPNNWKKLIEQAIIKEGYEGGAWFYKCPKMCHMWPIWYHAFPDAKWIIVRRNKDDIIRSCLKTSFMQAFKDEAIRKIIGVENEEGGWLWWVHQHEDRFREMIDKGLNCKVIWPERTIKGDYSQIIEMIEWLGLTWNKEVLSFVDPKLWHDRRSSVSISKPNYATNNVELSTEKPFNPIPVDKIMGVING